MKRIPDKVQATLRSLPEGPGVYLMRDASGRIVYVGKALSLRKRVASYFRESSLRRGDSKLRSLVHSIADLDLIELKTEAEAILMEGRLIKEYRPRFNILFKDDKRFILLRIHPGEPVPRLESCRLAKEDGARYFGPYPNAAAAHAAKDFVQRSFRLRVCRPRHPGPEDHRHCHEDILRTCSAPCIGRITPEAYHERAQEAAAFLQGERPAVLADVRREMMGAAKDLHFERAAALRDTLHLLTEAIRRRIRMARTPQLKADDARAGIQELQDRLALPALPRLVECMDVSTISGTHAVASLVAALDGRPAPARYRRFRIQTVEGSNDPAMIAEVVRRRFQRQDQPGWEKPGLLIVDGGITQLRAARAALRELGLAEVPTVGLAKRFEEVVTGPESRETVLRLPENSPALRVLKGIRDEAHRFALTYHRALRGRRIRESVLDDLPGIGPKRKTLLLQQFGSVARLRKAPVETIARTPGIGPELALAIHEHLARSAARK
jgi:excinuclease ABC subunit C